MAYSVLIVDDHPLILGGFSALIGTRPEFELVGALADGESALAFLRDNQPDLAVLDMNVPKLSGLDVLNVIHAEGLRTRCILISASFDRLTLHSAVRAGAAGLLRKDSDPNDIVRCLLDVAGGLTWLPELNAREFGGESALTMREREIVALAVRGLSNKDIARRLTLSEGTVKIHIYNIFRKLNVKNRTELANVYLKGGRAD